MSQRYLITGLGAASAASETAISTVNEVKAWARQGIEDAGNGLFTPEQAGFSSWIPGVALYDWVTGRPEGTAGASARFDVWLKAGERLVDKLQALRDAALNQTTVDYLNVGIELIVEATGPGSPAVMAATDLTVLTRLILHIDQGVGLLLDGIGELAGWGIDRLILPLGVAAIPLYFLLGRKS